jgi:diguanylate cyclase (GGDEF)-like protein/PAS domain S-box-containing protein
VSSPSEDDFRRAFDDAGIGMGLTSADGRWLRVNRALLEMTGHSEAELLGTSCHDVVYPPDIPADVALIRRLLAGELERTQSEQRYVHKRGNLVWVTVTASLIRDREGRPLYRSLQVMDISERVELQQRFRATFDHASVGIMHSSLDRRVLMVNRKFCDMVGYSAEELQQGSVRRIHHPEDSDADQHLEKRLVAGEIDSFSFEKRYVRKDGSVFWAHRTVSLARDEPGRPQYFIRIIEDISERKQAEQELVRLAHYDRLTTLPNRALFHDRLTQTLAQARRSRTLVATMFLDLDHFKMVNDTLGHAMGDLLLKQVAHRLTACVRANDTVGRLGGDEFGVIVSGLATAGDAHVVARKIVQRFGAPFQLEGHERYVTTSIGISVFPEDGEDEEVLIKAADAAMYTAKDKGRNTFEFCGEGMGRGKEEGGRVESVKGEG